MDTVKIKKVDYQSYDGKFNDVLLQLFAEHPEKVNLEMMREMLYGQTFTDEYKSLEIPDELYMDYWAERAKEIFENNDDFEWQEVDNSAIAKQLLGDDCDLDPTDYDADSPQELMLLLTIESTGDGLTPETAKYVTDVHQEYEYMQRVFPYNIMKQKCQTLYDGIDCIEFEETIMGVNKLYFDISRRFEVGYLREK